MDTLRNVRLELPDGSYSDKIPLYISADLVDLLNNKTLKEYIKENNNDIYNLQTINNNNTIALATLSKAEIHAAASTSAMTNTDYIYVNISDGYWYSYYNNAWTKGGLFQATYEHDFEEDYNRMASMMENNVKTGTSIDTYDSAYWKAKMDFGENTFQQIYEGYNLFKPTLTNNGTDILTNDCTVMLNGDVFSLTVTGADCYFGAARAVGGEYSDSRGYKIDVTNITNIKFEVDSNIDNNYITAYNSEDISLGNVRFTSNTGNYTVPEGASFICFRFGKKNANIGDTYTTKVLLYAGSETKTYEPYVRRNTKSKPRFSTGCSSSKRK